MYELDGVPTYNCEAVREFTHQRIDHNRQINALKRKQERRIGKSHKCKKKKKN